MQVCPERPPDTLTSLETNKDRQQSSSLQLSGQNRIHNDDGKWGFSFKVARTYIIHTRGFDKANDPLQLKWFSENYEACVCLKSNGSLFHLMGNLGVRRKKGKAE